MTRTHYNTDADPRNLSSQTSSAPISHDSTDPSQGPSTPQGDARTLFNDRLAEAQVAVRRFICLEDGTKQSYVNHTDPANQYNADEVDGNYGVIAGDGLLIIDIDDYRSGVDALPDTIEALPDTFTVKTPHDGEHRYYAIDGIVNNRREDWGEIRAENQYVVGPGSELQSCTKGWHDCSERGAGEYSIYKDRAIATVSSSVFPIGSRHLSSVTTSESPRAAPERVNIDDIDAPFGQLETRLQAFLKGTRRKALWEGRYSDVGFDDRSNAEGALSWHLGWFFEGNEVVVGQLLSLACSQYPTTDWGEPRKWLVRTDDSYRKNTCCLPNYGNTYNPPSPRTGPRPEVSQVTSDHVLRAVFELSPATTTEIAEHDAIDVGKEQTRKALVELANHDVIARKKDRKRPNNPYVYFPAFEDDI